MKNLIFIPELAQGVYEGRVTQAREVIKPQPSPKQVCKTHDPKQMLRTTDFDLVILKDGSFAIPGSKAHLAEARFQVGEKFYVKEKWATDDEGNVWYKAEKYDMPLAHGKWKSSRFLPEWAARSICEVTGVRVEQVQELSVEDCISEGAGYKDGEFYENGYIESFESLWDSINPKYPWDSNPFNFVYEFKKGVSYAQR